jgi:DNA-binding response OmpR family regulator
MIVEDEIDHLELFSTILENEGMTVDSYSDPHTALSNFKAGYYDLIIMDYLLPNFNGVQLYNKLKSIDNSVRVVILTASQERIETSELEHLQVLRKPILPLTFIEQIRKILN